MADEKLIDIAKILRQEIKSIANSGTGIDLLDTIRQEQEKTTSELITTRHAIQVMSNSIVEQLSLLPSIEKTLETNETQQFSFQEMKDAIVEGISSLPSSFFSKEKIEQTSTFQEMRDSISEQTSTFGEMNNVISDLSKEKIEQTNTFGEMKDAIVEQLSFLPTKEEAQGISDVQSIESSLELANLRDDLRDGFQSVVEAVNGLSAILNDIEKNTFFVMDETQQYDRNRAKEIEEQTEISKKQTEESNSIFTTIKETLVSKLPSREEKEEEENEDDRQHKELIDALEGTGSGGAEGETKKKGGLFGGLMSGIGKIGKGLAKPLKGLFGFLGSIGKLFKTVGGFLLKPIAWLIGGAKGILGIALGSISSLLITLGGIAALFAGVGAAAYLMTDEEFDKLKNGIAEGVAGAISRVVGGAIDIWNKFVPETWKISEDDKKNFEKATFEGVRDTIIGVVDFAKEIADAFGAGFTEKMEPFKKSWDNFKVAFQGVVNAFSNTDLDLGIKSKTVAVAETVGGIVASIATFFTDLATALLGLTVGKTDVTDNEFINTAAGIVKSIVLFIKDLVVSFGEGFADTFSGISDKFKTLKDKIGKVTDKLGEIFTSIGASAGDVTQENKKTLMGVFNILGNALGKFIEGILSVGNFIADLIIDPTVTLAKLRASITNGFDSMARTIGDFLEGMFSKESILKLLKNLFGDSLGGQAAFKAVEGVFGTMEDAAKEAQKEREDNIKNLEDRNKILTKSADETEKQLKAELALGKDRDEERVKNLQLALDEERGEIEINKKSIERTKDKIQRSEDIIVREKVEEKMGKEAIAQADRNEKLKKEIKETKLLIEMEKNQIISADTAGWGGETFSMKNFEGMMKIVSDMSGGKITAEQIASGEAQLTQEMIDQMHRQENIDEGDVKNKEDAMIVFSAGFEKIAQINARHAEIQKKQAEIDSTDEILKKKEKQVEIEVRADIKDKESKGYTGGLVLKGGLAKIHQGELLMDNDAANMMANAAQILSTYLPTSGTMINQLQMDRMMNGMTGKNAEPIVIDNSQQPTIINQTNVAAPQTRGPALVGEGRDKVNMR